MRPKRYVLNHAIAAGVVTIAIAAFAAAVYFALLGLAMLFGEDLGGPLALPFMVLTAVIGIAASVWLVILPVTALTERICVKRGIRWLWQVPITTAAMGSWLLVLALAIAAIRDTPMDKAATVAGIVFLALLLPLGLYWWTMQSVDWIVGATARWWKGRKARGKGHEDRFLIS